MLYVASHIPTVLLFCNRDRSATAAAADRPVFVLIEDEPFVFRQGGVDNFIA